MVRNCAPENLEILRGAIAHLWSGPSDHPGMTALPSLLLRRRSWRVLLLRLFLPRLPRLDIGLGRQRAFAEHGQEAIDRVLADHEGIRLVRLSLLQRAHLGDGV